MQSRGSFPLWSVGAFCGYSESELPLIQYIGYYCSLQLRCQRWALLSSCCSIMEGKKISMPFLELKNKLPGSLRAFTLKLLPSFWACSCISVSSETPSCSIVSDVCMLSSASSLPSQLSQCWYLCRMGSEKNEVHVVSCGSRWSSRAILLPSSLPSWFSKDLVVHWTLNWTS